jgi:flagellar hook assembly protein FlgD
MVEEKDYRSMIERSGLAMASKTISLKPDGLVLNKKMRISFDLKDFISEDLSYWNFKIMENVNEQWIDIHTDYMNNQLAVAQVDHLGKYALFIDPDAIESLPEEFYFSGNYPNPFNSSTTIKYTIPGESYVKVSVFNVQGQRVNVLVDQVQEPGYKSINWNGRSQSGYVLPSGVYFVVVQQNNETEVKKVMMIK